VRRTRRGGGYIMSGCGTIDVDGCCCISSLFLGLYLCAGFFLPALFLRSCGLGSYKSVLRRDIGRLRIPFFWPLTYQQAVRKVV
jgi:hypothetical protein